MREAILLPCASRAMPGFMPSVVSVGEQKKPRLNRDILRCSRNSVKKGLDNSFITTSTMKEIVVVISAAIGNTSFRNSGIRPMNYRYPSVGFPLFVPHAWDKRESIINKLFGQIKAGRGRSLLYSKVFRGTGVGSHAQKAEIKRGINPLTERTV